MEFDLDTMLDRAFVVFGEQDSGCLSYGVDYQGRRWFVKRAITAQARIRLREQSPSTQR